MKLFINGNEACDVLALDFKPGEEEVHYIRQFGSSAVTEVPGRKLPDIITFLIGDLPQLNGKAELRDENGNSREILINNISITTNGHVITAIGL
jgi:hypothetical protein